MLDKPVKTGVRKFFSRLPRIRSLLWERDIARIVRSQGSYDAIHVHYASLHRMRLARLLAGKEKRLVVSFWGGDVQRVTRRHFSRILPYLQRADFLTYTSQGQLDALHGLVGELLDDKLVQVHFGVTNFDAIDVVRECENRDAVKRHLGIPPDKLTVTVGYNGYREQQHLQVLEALSTLGPSALAQLTLILPVAYGASPEYLREIRKELDVLGCDSMVLNDWIEDPKEVARLRLASDFYINAQTTDALSSSFQEYLYAGSICLSGSWLRYDELKSAGNLFEEFSNFSEIPALLEDRIGHGVVSHLEDREAVRLAMRRMSSWSSLSPTWLRLYS